MKGRIQGRRAKWLRVGFAVSLLIAAHALHSGSAEAATSAPQPVLLVSSTSQNFPAWFRISADGRKLTVAEIAVSMTCTSGAQFVVADDFAHVAISKNGTLHGTYSQPPTAGSSGETYPWADSITARLNHRHTRLSGVWRLSINASYTNGMSDQCTSGPVRFTAVQ